MDSNMMALIPLRKELNVEFLYSKIVMAELYKIADTSSIPQINNKHIEPYVISTPCLEEQQKIANFLSSIDAKIESTSQQINRTQNFKKGLLQQMFV
jgi:type I restriction enzyme S subunit